MSNDVIDQLRTYLDFAAGESTEEVFAVAPLTKAGLRWYQRGPVLAAFAALLVLAVAIPALLLGNGQTPLGSQLLDPLDVGVERVWPDAGFVGNPDEIAAEFARTALGWVDVETVSDLDAPPDGPVWTTIRHAGSEDLDVLSIPIGEGRRVLIQVGSRVVTAGMETEDVGQIVGIPQVPGAVSAILHIRFAAPDRVEVVEVDQSDLEQGRVEVGTDSAIGGIVLVYLDANGTALTATGAHFGPFEASAPPTTMTQEPSTTSTINAATTVQPTEGDLPLVDAFVEFSKNPSAEAFSNLPLAENVSLGLGPEIVRSVNGESLQDPQSWMIDVAEFRAYAGPFSPLDLLSTLDDYTVQVGEHSHCAGPPQPPPNGLDDHKRVSVQPSDGSIDSCLDWMTVDLFVGQSGQVEAITMDLWEP